MHPFDNEQLKYEQLYIIDTNEAIQTRAGAAENADCLLPVFAIISNVMNNNPYTAAYQNMRTIEREEQDRATLENIPPRKITAIHRRSRCKTVQQSNGQRDCCNIYWGRRCTSIT